MDWMTYKHWLGKDLLSDVPKGAPCPTFDQLVTDSRSIKSGDWFLPLKGETFDGHEFIEEAILKGASGFLSERNPEFKSTVPFLKVKNTMKAYHAIASGWRSSLPASCELVALTGSVGKTTVKTLTNLMLSHIASTSCTPGNQNTDFAIPKALLQLTPQHRFGIFEFGARKPGDIAFLTETVKPKVCVCINVASAHIGMFGDRATTMKTKLEIVEYSPQDSVAVVLHDDAILLGKARDFKRKLISFGYHPEADVAIVSVNKNDMGTDLVLKISGKELKLNLQVFHQSYPINIAAALAVGLALNLPPEQCRIGLETFNGIKGRYQVFKTRTNLTVIDDSYNASPESMKAGLTSLKTSFPKAKKALILGDMRELGNLTEEAHRGLGPVCFDLQPTLLITVGEFSKLIAEEAIKLGFDSKSAFHFPNSDKLLATISRFYKNADVFYAKGSNALQLSRVVDHIILENS